MARKLNVNLTKNPIMQVQRGAVHKRQCVYVLTVNKPQKYAQGKSRIIYIGTTEKGAYRVAASAAFQASKVFEKEKLFGVRTIYAHILSSKEKPGVETWKKLEFAALMAFKRLHFELPMFNIQYKNSNSKHARCFEHFAGPPLEKKLKAIDDWLKKNTTKKNAR